MNIFVGSLPFSLGEADLKAAFEAYGTVDSVKIITDKVTGRSKGFGFIEMSDDEAGEAAINELNGSLLGGRNIVVNKSEPRPQQERRSFSNNRGGGFNRDNNRGGYGGGGDRGGYNRNSGGGDYNRGGRY
ncbi:RNA-binding protein [Flavobacterium akiainvivens]|uniref:RNA-binding protein n=1 Tax=Flavobacterium akiainvivens TaxID=1202724 RepID=A0A0M9VJ80_9FLAO|nr:RNA-binding protein [Flavobacterium akiainvivens]KOS07479.1 RNA-binding protein [Flavobacterium akiainvivens]SFQ63442.1 RNA recognition motif. (a.k.a. RRM, RBD, or RNP domain) [Flavobacterium akiainvivens]